MKKKKWRPRLSKKNLCLRSRRLEIRPLRESDYSAWLAANLRLDKAPRNRFDSGRPSALKLKKTAFRRKIRKFQQSQKNRTMFCFGVFDRESGAHLGGVDLFILNREMRWANLGYAFHHHAWGKGYASEAAALALQIGFGSLDLFRIEASCERENKASARVALNAGLVPEGRRLKFPIPKKCVDLDVFGMNAIDFSKRKAKRK